MIDEPIEGTAVDVTDDQAADQTPAAASVELARRPTGAAGAPTQLIAGTVTERVTVASEVAEALHQVIVDAGLRTKTGSQKRLDPKTGEPVKDSNGREIWDPRWHVNVEGWATLATLLGCAIVPHPPRAAVDPSTGEPIIREFNVREKQRGGGEREWTVRGHDWQVTVDVVKDGATIASGTGYCSRTEKRWIDAEEYALQSMAATRGTGRAMKTAASWIVALKGYSSTPAEEMPAGGDQPPAQAAEPRLIGKDEWQQLVTAVRELVRADEASSPSDGQLQVARDLLASLKGSRQYPTVEAAKTIAAVHTAYKAIQETA